MPALTGEVNPQSDRDFADRFTVASFNDFGDYINGTDIRLFPDNEAVLE